MNEHRHPVKTILISTLLALSAGACDFQWDDFPGARLRPVNASRHSTDVAWRAEVADAAATWNEGLVALGCSAPFQETMMVTPGAGGHRVRLIDVEDWPHSDTLDGLTTGDFPSEPQGSIDILYPANARDGHLQVLLHEMGHALGLGHADPDAVSVMVEGLFKGSRPTPKDYLDAAGALGCTP